MSDALPPSAAIFDAAAAAYEAPRRRLVPSFDAFYGAAVDALSLLPHPPRRVLDLGAGTGLLAARVAAAHPGAELVLVDAAPAMLEQAVARLGPGTRRHVADLRDPLPQGPFDAVVSALAIHHLADAEKRSLTARVATALTPGGVFVNAEQVAGATPAFDAWLADWHARRAAELGADADEWRAALQRMRHDRLSPVEEQLAWLREAGLEAECTFRDHRFAVLVGRRPG